MRAHGLPMDALDGGGCRVLVLGAGDQPVWAALGEQVRYELRQAANGFEAGMVAQQFRPHVIVMHVASTPEEESAAICRNIKSSAALGATKVIAAVAAGSRSRRWYLEQGFDECLVEPLSLAQVTAALQQATDLLS
jgi:CheY-like chemotaxis protein